MHTTQVQGVCHNLNLTSVLKSKRQQHMGSPKKFDCFLIVSVKLNWILIGLFRLAKQE